MFLKKAVGGHFLELPRNFSSEIHEKTKSSMKSLGFSQERTLLWCFCLCSFLSKEDYDRLYQLHPVKSGQIIYSEGDNRVFYLGNKANNVVIFMFTFIQNSYYFVILFLLLFYRVSLSIRLNIQCMLHVDHHVEL